MLADVIAKVNSINVTQDRAYELMSFLKHTRNTPRMSRLYGWACWSIVQWQMVQTLRLCKVTCCNPWDGPQKLVCHALVLLWPKHTVLKCYRLLEHYYFCLSRSISFISSCQKMSLFYPSPFFWCPNLSFTIASEKLFKRALSISHFHVGWFFHKHFSYLFYSSFFNNKNIPVEYTILLNIFYILSQHDISLNLLHAAVWLPVLLEKQTIKIQSSND